MKVDGVREVRVQFKIMLYREIEKCLCPNSFQSILENINIRNRNSASDERWEVLITVLWNRSANCILFYCILTRNACDRVHACGEVVN